jgi:hypothetical protein
MSFCLFVLYSYILIVAGTCPPFFFYRALLDKDQNVASLLGILRINLHGKKYFNKK